MQNELKLRPFQEADLPGFAKYANNYKVSDYMTDAFPHPYSLQDAMNFFERFKEHCPSQVLAIEWKGDVVGAIGIHPQNDIHQGNAEMGYWIAEPFWGQGLAGEAIKRMIQYAFENFDIQRIFARPFGSNKASHRVLEKNGFTLEARFEKTLLKNGRVEDELVYAIRRQ